jgi:hypothetical protein
MLGMKALRVAGAAANRVAIAVCLSREERAIEAIVKYSEDSCGCCRGAQLVAASKGVWVVSRVDDVDYWDPSIRNWKPHCRGSRITFSVIGWLHPEGFPVVWILEAG